MSFPVVDRAELPGRVSEEKSAPVDAPRRLISGWKAAVGFPLAAYVASRLLVILSMHLARQLSDPWRSYGDLMKSWDGANYLDIVMNGYSAHLLYGNGEVQASSHGFFPAYQLLARLVDLVVPGGALAAMVVTSLVCGAVAVVLLWQLARTLFDRTTADGSVLLFCFFPGSFAFSFAYAEGLQLACVAASILLIVRKQLLWAALFAAVATATRPSSLALALVFGVLLLVAVRRRQDVLRSLSALVLSISGFVSYCVFLHFRVGDFFAWFRVERSGFNEGVDLPGSRGLGIVRDFLGSDLDSPPGLFTVLFLVLMIAMLVASVLPGPPLWMRLYIVGCLYFPFSAFVAPLSPRLMLSAFPALVVLAKHLPARVITIVVAIFSAFLVTLTAAYGTMEELPFRMWAP